MSKTAIRLSVISAFVCGMVILNAAPVFGWGSGHTVQTQVIVDNMESEMRSCFSDVMAKDIINKHCKYADSFASFGAEIPDNIKPLLKKAGITKRYPLHHEQGQAISMLALITLLKEKNYNAAALWVGNLSHAIGDAGAINHHALMHFYQHSYPGDTLKLPGGRSLRKNGPGSLVSTFRSPTGKKFICDMMAGYEPGLLVKPGENMGRRALLRLMDLEYLAANNLAEKTELISLGWQKKVTASTPAQKKEGERMGLEGFASICTMPAKLVLDALHTAHYMAKNDVSCTFDDFKWARRNHGESLIRAVAARPLGLESIFKGLLQPEKPTGAKIVVLVEPTYTMNRAQLGFASKYHAAAMMKIMKENSIPYMTLDARDVYNKGLPSPTDMPVMVLASARNPSTIAGYSGLKLTKIIAKYAAQGGRILHVGQRILPAMSALSSAKAASKARTFPIPGDAIVGSTLTIHKALGVAPTDIKRTFTFNLQTPGLAGWQWPRLYHTLKSGKPNIVPILTVNSRGENIDVGAFSINKNMQITGAFIPEVAVFPYMFDEKTVTDVHMAHYDPTGARIALAAIKAMVAGKLNADAEKTVRNNFGKFAAREKAENAAKKIKFKDLAGKVLKEAQYTWDFTKSKGSILACIQDARQNGKIAGATWVEDPQRQRALSFQVGNKVTLGNPNGLSIGKSDFAIAAWIRPNPDMLVKNRGGMIYTRGGYTNPAFTVYFSTGPVLRLQVRSGKQGAYRLIMTSDGVLDGRWHHFIASLNYAKRELRLFVDGRLTGTASFPQDHILFDSKKPAYIGWGGRNYKGLISDFSVFRKWFTEEEAEALYTATKK